MRTNIFGEHFRKLSSRRLRRLVSGRQVVRLGSNLLGCETVGKDGRQVVRMGSRS
jgi:hypothetical protein